MGFAVDWPLWNRQTKLSAPRSFESLFGTTVDCLKASQGVYMLPPILTRAQLKQCSDQVTTGTTSTRVMVGGGKSEFHIKNQTNVVCKCKIYEFYTRRNGGAAATDDPYECWKQFMTDQAVDTFTTEATVCNAVHKIDQKPYCSDVGYRFKIGRVTSLHLEPGMQHNHVVHHKWYKVLRSEAWQGVPDTLKSVQGWTRHFMVVWYSSLVHDTAVVPTVAVGAMVKEQAGFTTACNVRLDIVVRHTWSMCANFPGNVVVTEEPTYGNTYKLGVANIDHMGENQDIDLDEALA